MPGGQDDTSIVQDDTPSGDVTIDAQQTWTLADGTTWANDANGNPYQIGYNPALITDGSTPVTIPNLNEMGYGPGGDPNAPYFTLGNVAQGVNAVTSAFTAAANAAPKLYNAIQQGKNAITAINTPTATQQWITMPLMTKILLGAGIVLAFYAVRHKI